MTIRLRLFTLPTCPKCPAAKNVVEEVARVRGDIAVEVIDMSRYENLAAALMLQIASAPSIALDEHVVAVGYVPSFEELNKLIEDYKKSLER